MSRKTRRQGRDRLSGKRAGRRRCRARHRALRPLRLQHHLHDLLRLHGPDQQGRQVSGREVRTRNRLQARPSERGVYDRRNSSRAAMCRVRSPRRCPKPAWPATSPRSRSQKSCAASTRSCSARSRSIRISSSRSSGSTPGSIRARKPMPPRRCLTRASTSSPSIPTPPHRCRLPPSAASHAFGQASDMIEFGPETQLTSIIDDWGPYYVERVKAVMDGTWEQADLARHGRGQRRHGALHQHAG
jgi:hypothetical protein